jgi:glycine cleavage system H protein
MPPIWRNVARGFSPAVRTGADMYPSELKYSKDHEWVRLDGTDAQVGITDYAQKQLGDVVYLELPEVGRTLKKGEVFGTIESVKAVSELYAPLSGEVTEVNSRLTEKPEAVNTDPHGSWMILVKVADPAEASDLLDASQYTDLAK